ncbi:SpoIIE family protein phosphatase [Halioxenophilus sp. WMMB6]|uniref:SpoIIE family protein phosphatase n=1 Tax=Halioxenophilus sp. WMMB6 TaxID=3073815 RepID=UPI00295E5BF8|nr:SpoIIE family protein phosphatase [Halioxenophilus sp. WMMB6]
MAIGKRKLLLIDDDRLVRESISAYLEDSGFEVIECDEGPRGLQLFREHTPDLVLSDLRMPGMDGLNVLKEIHKIDVDAPVIVISGAGVMGDVVEALRLGASDFLIKPVADMEVLVHSITKTLERQDLLLENRRYRDKLEAANRELRENLLVLERDQRAGRLVQERLLPISPFSRNGYTVAHKIIPSLYLSGDFIDYAYLGDRYLAFYLTDVSGHGASSAFVTVWLKHQVTRMVRDNNFFTDVSTFEEGPNWLLKEINGGLKGGRFENHLTCLIGVIDTHEHELRYAVAGHLPLPILKVGNQAHYLEGKGKPVGIFSEVEWQVFRHSFAAGTSLIALSDGVFEVMGEVSVIEKEARLLELVASSDGSLESITANLGVQESRELPDDISVLTITRGQ